MPARLIGPRRPSGAFYKKRPAVRKPRVPRKATNSLTAAIKKVIAREQETKHIGRDTLNAVSFNSVITSTSELYSCVPQMGVGTGSFQHIGQTLRPRSLRIRGTIGLSSDDVTADVVAYMYVFTSKKFKHFPDLQSGFNINSLLATGQGTTTNPTGTPLVALYPVEKEAIVLLNKKTFHLQKGYGLQNSGGGSDLGVGAGNNTFRSFDIKIKCPATLQYDDNVGTLQYPNNFAPVVGFGYYHTDGTSPDILNQAIQVNMRAEMYFDDA